MDVILLLILIAFTLGTYINIKNKEKKYKKEDIKSLMSGFEVSRKILDAHDLNNVYITESRESLVNYYNAERKVIRLVKGVFNDTSINSCAVSALESAHVLQDKSKDKLFNFRKNLIPFIKTILYVGYLVIVIGIFFGHMKTLLIGIALEYVVLIFNLATYKIEKNAVEIAKKELVKEKIVTKKEMLKIEEVLKANSFIYIASIILPIAEFTKRIVAFGNSNK